MAQIYTILIDEQSNPQPFLHGWEMMIQHRKILYNIFRLYYNPNKDLGMQSLKDLLLINFPADYNPYTL